MLGRETPLASMASTPSTSSDDPSILATALSTSIDSLISQLAVAEPTPVPTTPHIVRAAVPWPGPEQPFYMYGNERELVMIDTFARLHAISKGPAWTSSRSAPSPAVAWRVEAVAGRDMALIAARDIPRGELIVTELPVLVVSNTFGVGADCSDESLEELYVEAVAGLAPASREAFLDLKNALEGEALHTGIRCTNGMGVPDFAALEDSSDGVFPILSRANHSCTPNAIFTTDLSTLKGSFYAVSPIKAGDEIFISYTLLCEAREERRHDLQFYEFSCTCECCELPPKKLKLSNARRTAISALLSPDDGSPPFPDEIGAVEDVLRMARDERLTLYDHEILEIGLQVHFKNLKETKGDLRQAALWVKRTRKAFAAVGKPFPPMWETVSAHWGTK